MFQGTIPQSIREMLYQIAAGWSGVQQVAVAGSGNLTVERVLHPLGFDLHGCDVSIYSCALGSYFARQPFRLALRDAHRETFGWIEDSLTTPAGALAALMLLTGLTDALDAHCQIKPNPYYTRLIEGYRRQWDTLLDQTRTKLESAPVQLAGFHIGDAVDWLPTLPQDMAVASFPPFFAGGYEVMWAKLDKLFDWDKPDYQEIFDDRRAQFLQTLTNRRHWVFMTPDPLPEYADHLRGLAQTTNRGVPLYLYAAAGSARVAVPHQKTAPVLIPRLAPGGHIGDTLHLVHLKADQFAALRSQYLNPAIKPASAGSAYGVMVDDRLVGVFALAKGYKVPGASADAIYLLSDFAVAPTDYPKLSKLVLYAALSREGQMLAERLANRRVRQIVTTAFSNHPVSMKYRGLFRLASRKENPHSDAQAEHRYHLNYVAPAGQWTLKDGFDEWRRRHAD